MSGVALKVENLSVSFGDLEILKGLDIEVPFGEVHALMGPNGSGKSTLCHALAGKAGYQVVGEATVDGHRILDLDVDERARAGLLQAFQYPVAVPGLGSWRIRSSGIGPNRSASSEAVQRWWSSSATWLILGTRSGWRMHPDLGARVQRLQPSCGFHAPATEQLACRDLVSLKQACSGASARAW